MKVSIYTDGAARGNPDGPGGYGVVLEYVDPKGELHVKELSGGYVRTTNNRMELMAVIRGLEALNRPCEVELYSDSQYVVNAFNQAKEMGTSVGRMSRSRIPTCGSVFWKRKSRTR